MTEQVPEWTVADRLLKARRWAGVPQQEMAAYLGVSRQALTRYENGQNVKIGTLRLWALRCGVSFDWLRYGTTESDRITLGAQLKCIAMAAGQRARAAG